MTSGRASARNAANASRTFAPALRRAGDVIGRHSRGEKVLFYDIIHALVLAVGSVPLALEREQHAALQLPSERFRPAVRGRGVACGANDEDRIGPFSTHRAATFNPGHWPRCAPDVTVALERS